MAQQGLVLGVRILKVPPAHEAQHESAQQEQNMQFNTEATITITGSIKDFKVNRDGDKPYATYNMGVKRYRGKDNKPEYVNYYIRQYGRDVDKLEGFKFGDGAIVAVTGQHDQRIVAAKGDKPARVYNNITCNEAALLRDGEVAPTEGKSSKGAAKGGQDDGFYDDDLPF